MPTFEEQLIEEFRERFISFLGARDKYEEELLKEFESFLLEKTRQVRETTLKEVGEILNDKVNNFRNAKMDNEGEKYLYWNQALEQCAWKLEAFIKELQ